MADDTRLPAHSASLADERLRELQRLLPEAFVEGKLDVEKLRAAVGDEALATGRERYGLSWAGKGEAVRTLLAPGTGTLRPCPDESVNFDSTENLIIEGDNLEVLKLLQKSYHGKVKLIYIDPPYNTGNDFIYNDDFRSTLDAYRRYTGEIDDAGKATTTNRDTSGRFHSNWLNMMYPRLHLARNLLREDGVIFVSIDDNEAHNLRMVMNEVFGDECFISNVIWKKKSSPDSRDTIGPIHDHILCYVRSSGSEKVAIGKMPLGKDRIDSYQNPDSDPRGPWASVDMTGMAGRATKDQFFEVTLPSGRKLIPPPGRSWGISPSTYEQLLKDNRIWFGRNGDNVPRMKRFLSEADGQVTPTVWDLQDVGSNEDATKEVAELFGGERVFDTPKPAGLLRRMLEITCRNDGNAIILDFFGGSGTTAHAVLDTNEADGGNRKFILVQLPEKTDKPDYPTIADITRERVRRVIKRIEQQRAEDQGKQDLLAEEKGEPQVLGFRALRLSDSNFRPWDSDAAGAGGETIAKQLELHAENLQPDRNAQDRLFELMLRAGLPLSARIDTIAVVGGSAWRITADEQVHLFCLAEKITQQTLDALRALQPTTLVCLDAAFAGNDALKTNTVLQMKDAGIRFHTA